MQSFPHITHGQVRFGLGPRRLYRALPFSNYSSPSKLSYPPVRAWERPINWLMLGNDMVGDCVIAYMLHQVMAWSAVANAGSPMAASFSTDQAIETYSAITGYVPGNDATDQGTDPDTAIAYWRDKGLYGHKAAGMVDLDISNLDALKGALNVFGGIGLSIQVPAYVMDVPAGGSWSDSGDGDHSIIGYHQVLGIGYGRQGFRVVSWGATYTCNLDFLARNLQASQAVVSEDWIKQSGQAPSGVDMEGLLADLKAT